MKVLTILDEISVFGRYDRTVLGTIDFSAQAPVSHCATASAITYLKNADVLPPQPGTCLLGTRPFATDVLVLLGSYIGTNPTLPTVLKDIDCTLKHVAVQYQHRCDLHRDMREQVLQALALDQRTIRRRRRRSPDATP